MLAILILARQVPRIRANSLSLSNPSPSSGMVQPVVNEMFATVHAAGSSLLEEEEALSRALCYAYAIHKDDTIIEHRTQLTLTLNIDIKNSVVPTLNPSNKNRTTATSAALQDERADVVVRPLSTATLHCSLAPVLG
eukprot:scaffold380_cov113-Isochrysis_galbana.AAC.1